MKKIINWLYTLYEGQTLAKERLAYNQTYHAIRLLKPKEICHCLNSVQYLRLACDCYKENRQCADNQCPQIARVNNVCEFVPRDTEKGPRYPY